MIRRSILAGLALAAAPAIAGEYTTYRMVDLPQAAGCPAPALLNLPAGWNSGDAAVVLLTLAPQVDAARDSLVAALLEDHAAVLEVVASRCPGGASDAAGAALGALRELHITEGAGLVVAIGYGPGGRAAAAAADEAEAAARLGPGGPRFAATLVIGDGPPAMLAGPEQPPALRAPLRLSLLCDALAQAGAGAALPSPGACRDALAKAATPDVQPVALRPR
ncbi:hypothetical protein J5Y09_00765 [Roseomonas sp. PWR1]|uniref:Alpha/beta hydrolase n=1 Tax=Roseomonas nitratireducens TaxID=2820810 RepID=A0ABS4AM54_9PROT|nr:hypothetical protein [Neoroseomonas nitratireducens]MBP0462428.1 hypothetical protein [Neoroseomonas nitratireducens]